jgi:hypothetical protein
MKTWFVIAAVTVASVGCSKPATPPALTAQPKDTPTSLVPVPPTEVPEAADALVYPEKADVVAILFRARELRQKFQFRGALDLVSKALELDPHSPSALSMQHELVETLKRIQAPHEPAPADPKSRRDAAIPA